MTKSRPKLQGQIYHLLIEQIGFIVVHTILVGQKWQKTGPHAAPHLLAPLAPWGSNIFQEASGIHLSSSLKKYQQNTKNTDFKNTGPPTAPFLLASLGVKKNFGRFLASILAQNITKNTKNADFMKTGSPGSQKIFWETSGIYVSSSLKKYHQKYQECRF